MSEGLGCRRDEDASQGLQTAAACDTHSGPFPPPAPETGFPVSRLWFPASFAFPEPSCGSDRFPLLPPPGLQVSQLGPALLSVLFRD